ncbi:MAG: YdeI/OmpD-associated family protein [Oscillospiraceae bacterium]|nr:YdeI/OmpD-associated family protein [Oscillospiraceae bacterium]
MNVISNGEVPMGFGMALAKNTEAMAYFSNLSPQQQKEILAKTKFIYSKEEMQAYVNHLPSE